MGLVFISLIYENDPTQIISLKSQLDRSNLKNDGTR